MFSKKSAEHPGSQPFADPARGVRGRDGAFSLLGADLKVTGDIAASADLHVDGAVDGDIACPQLVQGETSTITGNISAEKARLAGTVQGAITVRELVILRTARIVGDVHYDALTIEQGAQVEGRFSHREEPAAAPPAPAKGAPELSVAS